MEGLFSLHGRLLVVVLFLLLGLRFYRERQLLQWVRRGMKNPLPSLPEPLDELVSRVARQREQARKRKRRLQNYLKSFRELTEAVPDIALIADKQGRLVGFNRHAQTVFRLNRRLDMGNLIDYVVRVEGVESFWTAMQGRSTLTVRLLSDDQSRYEFLRLPLQQGNTLLIARDITELMTLDSKRKAFIDNASHELKTPLTVIMGFLEVMQHQQDIPERWLMPVQEMYRHADKMNTLIQDMLRLARLESDDNGLQETNIDVSALVHELVMQMNQQYPKSVGVQAGELVPMMIRADANVLSSIIGNLLQNALLHAGSRHPVLIRTSVSNAWIEIIVQDDGVGIPVMHLNRITERFYRVDKSRRNAKGTGLGLAIVKHGIENHGGELSIISEEGYGATFTVKLPRSRLVSVTGA